MTCKLLNSWKHVLPIVLGVSLGTSLFAPFSAPAYAQTVGTEIPVTLDGKPLNFDVPPVIRDNRVLVPLRVIFESLGAQVTWNGTTRTVTAVKGQTRLEIPIDSSTVYKNGQPMVLDAPAEILQNRTLVPIRFVSEALGETVNWVNHSVVILTPQNQSPNQTGNWNPTQTQTQPAGTGSPTNSADSQVPQASIEVTAGDATVSSQQLQSVKQTLQDAGIVPMLEKDLNLTFQQPVTIKVSANQQGYQAALLQAGISVSDASTITDGSSGLALDSTIYFPLSENNDSGKLQNILAHELTHVLLNQAGMGDSIPSWINEGIAWTEGLKAEYQNAPQVLYQGQISYMRETLLDAFQTSNWQALMSNPEDTIHSTNAYNVEWQDYFAVDFLRQTYGWHAIETYLQDLLQQTPQQAFQSAFGVTQSTFEQTFDQSLAKWKQKPDHGVEVTLRVSDSFHGNIAILLKGSKVWNLYQVKSGAYTIDILPDGTITGLPDQTGTASTTDSPDPNTVFIGIEPDQPFSENGKSIARAGFALASKYGQDYYLNSWTVDSSQQSAFDTNVSHLGVELLNVQPLP